MNEPEVPLPPPDADALLAIELALGMLDHANRAAAERRVQEDAAFAALVVTWERRALALLEGREEQPPERVWTAIARALPGNDDGRIVRWWQTATAVAASVALALGGTLALRREASPPPVVVERRVPVPVPAAASARPLVAVLASAERDDVVAVSYDAQTRRISALPRGLETGGREAQLWVIPAGGKPLSAGLLKAGDRSALAAEARVAALIVPGATLAISLEPRGGSRTGSPTGPVILTGVVARS